MATPRFVGAALAVAQVDQVVVGGTVEIGDLFVITVNTKAASTPSTTTSTATTATEVDTKLAALDDDLYPEFTEFDATVSGSTVTLTGTEEGVPFTATATTTESNGGAADTQTFVLTTATAASGPWHWGTAANWSTGVAPVDADSVYIDNYDGDILYDLDQSAVEPALLEIPQSFTGTLGLPKRNEDLDYPEYRSDYLTIGPTTCIIGRGPGSGSGRIKLNFGTDQVACIVENSGSPLESDLEAILLKGSHASNTLTVRGDASVGVAVFGAETAVIATLSVEDNARVRCGAGTTLTTVNVLGGELTISSNVTTLNVYDGTVTILGTATVSALNVYGGLVIYNSTGAITNAFVGENGQIDFSQGIGAVTVSNAIESYTPTPVIDPDKRVASLIVDFNGMAEPMAGWGPNLKLTRGAVT